MYHISFATATERLAITGKLIVIAMIKIIDWIVNLRQMVVMASLVHHQMELLWKLNYESLQFQ